MADLLARLLCFLKLGGPGFSWISPDSFSFSLVKCRLVVISVVFISFLVVSRFSRIQVDLLLCICDCQMGCFSPLLLPELLCALVHLFGSLSGHAGCLYYCSGYCFGVNLHFA